MVLRRSAVSTSVCAALAVGVPVRQASATDYASTVTGSSTADTAYAVTTDSNGKLIYNFLGGDRISVASSQAADVRGVSLIGTTSPVVLQAGSAGTGALTISTSRTSVTNWGTSTAIDVQAGSNLTVNGRTTINASSDNANSAAIGVNVYRATATFNGDTSITTSTPGYSQGINIYQGNVTFNGNTDVSVQAKGQKTAGIYNSGGGTGNVTFNGNVSMNVIGVYPSDDVYAVYNDNSNTKLNVNGNLTINAESGGSSVMGIRNQGKMFVGGDLSITATGPRSATGIWNTYRTAGLTVNGDTLVKVTNTTGYTPFGQPTAIKSVLGTGSTMTFNGAVDASVSAVTTAFGIDNNGVMNFASTSDAVTVSVSSTCDACNVYGISQFGGAITMAGGAHIDASTTGTGAAFAIANAAAAGVDSTLNINQGGYGKVTLNGDIATADYAGTGNKGTTNIVLNTSDSYWRGSLVPYTSTGFTTDTTNYTAGATTLSFTGGATWIPTGAASSTSDFGAGGLTLGSGGGIDMSRNWGTFSPGNVPTYSLRTLTIGSSATAGASVQLRDGATFTLISDVRNGTADKIVFGPGVSSFSASGTQNVKIAYDPVLSDTSWVNASTIQNGKTFAAGSPMVIVDASAAAGGNARFSAVAGADSTWSQTYENALVSFTYRPQVTVSSNGSQLLLTGIAVVGSGTDGQTPADSADGSSGTTAEIRPAEAVLTAGETLHSMRNLLLRSAAWTTTDVANSSSQDDDAESHVWATPMASRDTTDTRYARQYAQDVAAVNIGGDWRVGRFEDGSARVGLSVTQGRGDNTFARGNGAVNMTALIAHASYKTRGGARVAASLGGAYLRAGYQAADLQDSVSRGEFHVKAASAGLEGGVPFKLGEGFSLEPSALAVGSVMLKDSGTTSSGVLMETKRTSFGLAKAGLTFKYSEVKDVYVRVAGLKTFGNEPVVTASKDGGVISTDAVAEQHGGHEVALGTSFAIGDSKAFAVTLEVAQQRLGNSTSGQSGFLNITYRW